MHRGLASLLVLSAIALVVARSARAGETLQWSGFALLRAAAGADDGPLVTDRLSSQVQIGVDWLPTQSVTAHVHLLARTDEGDERTRRGTAGVPEAYLEARFRPGRDRLRIRAGAFFLPTSRENVDALWETPYTITSSALNSWLGEEFRPVGVDASYFRGRAFAGATVFRGNDTFGALPPVRGWTLSDHWTLLGEWVPVEPHVFTSVSAETDGRLGWSARGGWNGQHLLVQVTHIDNRSDGLEYGELYNWGTRFDLVAFEYNREKWTVAGETGWGPTFLVGGEGKWVTDLRASYVLVSRVWPRARATVRVDSFRGGPYEDEALTLAYFWRPPGPIHTGIELTTLGGEQRALVQLRYRFGGRS